MAKNHGLGKGLDALFTSATVKDEVLEVRSGVREIELSKISAKNDQPRRVFDESKIEELAFSIKEHGVLQPIVLIEREIGHYTIIAGERRFRAAQRAGLNTIPAVVRSADELGQLEMALVENIQREDLDPIEQALSIKRLHEEFSQSYTDIARRLGKAETTIVNLSRLLGLPAPYQKALQDKQISEGHARALLSLSKNPEAQSQLFARIVNEHWSVRKAELFVQVHKDGASSKREKTQKLRLETKETKQLSKRLKAPVSILRTAKGGKITINFKNEDDLTRLLTLL